ncbi:MAG: hypothetical protein M3Q65_16525 [Chloroflexota bacterium]|nr:hypothetical protein [Chloroflexota bacterium]
MTDTHNRSRKRGYAAVTCQEASGLVGVSPTTDNCVRGGAGQANVHVTIDD